MPLVPSGFDINSYHYELPGELIAQHPSDRRDQSRLLIYDFIHDEISHKLFHDITDYLEEGDLVVINDSRVFPARLMGRKETGGRVELLMLEYPQVNGCTAEITGLLRSSKKMRTGQKIYFAPGFSADILYLLDKGKIKARLNFTGNLDDLLHHYGEMPLPPYINREEGSSDEDRQRYQTVYAAQTGSVAAPTAGLHFSRPLLDRIRKKGVELATVTLHVGYGTFAPVRVGDIRQHRIHSEFVSVSKKTAEAVNQVRKKGKKLWVVGTTTARSLEFAADESGKLSATRGWCNLYIYPGYRFRVVSNLITNFHLPGSSLLFLVSALTGRNKLLYCYREAVRNKYRFFSYGDGMLIMN
ncbi:MAG: tRNA preQ1(34) S-adenosylmethionine ribosyltransferase-isomerase QueA [Thermodesulfobacteriota bacterium]